MRRPLLGVAVALLVVAVAPTLRADCYSCGITSSGTPYCKSKSSGGAECYSNVNPWFCQIYGECGGYVEPEVMDKALIRCSGERLMLASVELPSAGHQPEFVLTGISVMPIEGRKQR